jgi:hypothetical protein
MAASTRAAVKAMGPFSLIPRFQFGLLDQAAVNSAFEEHGAVIIERGEAFTRKLASQMGELFDAATAEVPGDVESDGFFPGQTKRVIGLVTRAPAVQPLITDSVSMGLCDSHLLPNCEEYQLNLTAGLSVGPGARDQVLHREDDLWPFFTVPRPHCAVASLTALSDFTAANGATCVVPGSHRWQADRIAEPHEIAEAVMPAGSTLYWAGGLLHGAGANTSVDDWRQSVFVSYALGWLRTEENQYLDVPMEVADSIDPKLAALIGYRIFSGGSLGLYDPTLGGPVGPMLGNRIVRGLVRLVSRL